LVIFVLLGSAAWAQEEHLEDLIQKDTSEPILHDFIGPSSFVIIADFDCVIEISSPKFKFPRIKIDEGYEQKVRLPAGNYTIIALTEGIVVKKKYFATILDGEAEVVVIELFNEYSVKRAQMEMEDEVDHQILVNAKYKILLRQGDELLSLGNNREAIKKYREAMDLGVNRVDIEQKIVNAGGSIKLDYGHIIDYSDNQQYKTVRIGNQIWMAENLAYDNEGSYEYPENSLEKYGNLYTWKAAMNACPEGWHLPSDDDFAELYTYVGRRTGVKLKSDDLWKRYKDKEVEGINAWGFNAFPAGWCDSFDGSFDGLGEFAGFWSSTVSKSGEAWYWNLHFQSAGMGRSSQDNKIGLSVRCLKD